MTDIDIFLLILISLLGLFQSYFNYRLVRRLENLKVNHVRFYQDSSTIHPASHKRAEKRKIYSPGAIDD